MTMPPVTVARRAPCRAFQVPKAGHTAAEYEDAWAGDDGAGVYAVADGASDSAFAGAWAGTLAAHFVACPPAEGITAAWLAPAQAAWQAAVGADDLLWYVAARVRAGAFATLVGLHLLPSEGGGRRWSAWAMGDSCLFHIAADSAALPSAAAAGFPIQEVAAFGNHPAALSSNPAANHAIQSTVATAQGLWQPGDCFVLATDALAQWLLHTVVADGGWPAFLGWLATTDAAGFQQFIDVQRAGGHLHNDDVTLLLVRPG